MQECQKIVHGFREQSHSMKLIGKVEKSDTVLFYNIKYEPRFLSTSMSASLPHPSIEHNITTL